MGPRDAYPRRRAGTVMGAARLQGHNMSPAPPPRPAVVVAHLAAEFCPVESSRATAGTPQRRRHLLGLDSASPP